VKNYVYRVQRKQIDSRKVCMKCPPLAQTQARKAVGYWSTALSLAAHTADIVIAHQCHEHDSDVIFASHVK